MNNKQITVSILAIFLLVIYAIFVWPTRYMYDHIGVGEGSSFIVRIDRFTGKAEWLMPQQGWVLMEPSNSNNKYGTPTPTPVRYIDPFDTPRPKK